jgi:hypothetical protein
MKFLGGLLLGFVIGVLVSLVAGLFAYIKTLKQVWRRVMDEEAPDDIDGLVDLENVGFTETSRNAPQHDIRHGRLIWQ